MSRFFYINLDQVYRVEKLLIDRDPSKQIVLKEDERFKDVVRYSSKYDTAVFLTIPKDPPKTPEFY